MDDPERPESSDAVDLDDIDDYEISDANDGLLRDEDFDLHINIVSYYESASNSLQPRRLIKDVVSRYIILYV